MKTLSVILCDRCAASLEDNGQPATVNHSQFVAFPACSHVVAEYRARREREQRGEIELFAEIGQ